MVTNSPKELLLPIVILPKQAIETFALKNVWSPMTKRAFLTTMMTLNPLLNFTFLPNLILLPYSSFNQIFLKKQWIDSNTFPKK